MKFNRIIPIIILLLLAPIVASAYKLKAVRGAVPNSYNFWFYQPDSVDSITPKPVIIFLHGASLCGNNLDRVRRYGTIDAIERGRNLDAYVIAPQNPGGAWKPEKVMNIVDWAMQHHFIDSTRVYVLGMSLGGYGTLDVAATYPDRIAAAMAFCGGATVKDLSGLNELPLWIVHGTADRAVAVGQSDRVVEAMKKSDNSTPRLYYDRVPGMNHSSPARFFYLDQCYEWLMSHRLTDEGRVITDRFDLVGSSKKSAYKGLKYKPKSKTAKKITKNKKNKTRKSKKKSTNK